MTDQENTEYTRCEIIEAARSLEVLQAQTTGDPDRIRLAYANAINLIRDRRAREREEWDRLRDYNCEHPWAAVCEFIGAFVVFIGVIVSIPYFLSDNVHF